MNSGNAAAGGQYRNYYIPFNVTEVFTHVSYLTNRKYTGTNAAAL